jgi:hypothetical protein
MSGGVTAWRKMFEEKSKASEEEEQRLNDTLAVMKKQAAGITNNARKEKAYKDIAAKEDELKAVQKVKIMTAMYAKADEMGMAAGLEYLTKEGPAAVVAALSSAGEIDLWNPNNFEAAARAASTISGMNKETLLGVVTSMNLGLEMARKSAGELKSEFKDVGTDAMGSVRDIVGTYLDAARGGEALDFVKLKGELKSYLSDDKIGKLISQIETNGYLVEEVLKGAEIDEDTLKKSAIENVVKPFIKVNSGDTENTRKELVKNTVSLNDIVGISKENAAYLAAISEPSRALADFAFATAQGVGKIYGLLAHWGDDSYKTDEEFQASNEGVALTKAVEDLQYASIRLADAQERGDTESEKKFQKQVDTFQNSVDVLAKARPDIVPQIMANTQEKAATRASSEIDLTNKISDFKNEIADLSAKKEGNTVSGIADIDKEIVSTQRKIAGLEAHRALNEGLQGYEFGKPAQTPVDEYALGLKKVPQLYQGPQGYPGPQISPAAQTGPAPSSVAHDFMAMTAGYQNIKKGDLVIDSGSLAKGISAGSGQLIGKMGASANSGATTVTVPITLTVGSVNGDVGDMLKKITPAIEQTFTRMFFDRQKRK